jgi:hypothetical protein
VILVTDHSETKSLLSIALKEVTRPRCIIFDGRRSFDPAAIRKLGLMYLGVGYGSRQARS